MQNVFDVRRFKQEAVRSLSKAIVPSIRKNASPRMETERDSSMRNTTQSAGRTNIQSSSLQTLFRPIRWSIIPLSMSGALAMDLNEKAWSRSKKSCPSKSRACNLCKRRWRLRNRDEPAIKEYTPHSRMDIFCRYKLRPLPQNVYNK